MARMKPDVLEEFLQRPIVAVLATTRRDGRPYQIPVWFLWQDGAFWITGTYTRVWCKHILAQARATSAAALAPGDTAGPSAGARVSLCIEATDPVARYVAIDCTAEPVEPKDADIWPISGELARKYVGSRPGATDADVERFLANMRTEPRLLFRLTPHHWRAIDLTVYRGSRGDVAYQQARAEG